MFHLIKWYLDCITDDGDVLIGYSARVRWGVVRLHYSMIQWFPADGSGPVKRVVWRRTPLPEVLSPAECHGKELNALSWRCPSLGVQFSMKPDQPPIPAAILDSQAGRHVTWNCAVPRSRVIVELEGVSQFAGAGYAEQLEMTMPPWQLPLEQLRWGRFLSPTDSLVWIQWRGAKPLDLLFHNGAPASSATITDDKITCPGMTLKLPRERVLREGELRHTTFIRSPLAAWLLPSKVLGIRETKWLSRAKVLRPEVDHSPVEGGWAISELVQFGNGPL